MSINIEVNGTLYPTTSGVSAEPTHDEIYGKGGYRTVADNTARLDIPTSYKSDGMLVFVRANTVTYQWNENLTSWSEYPNNITGVQIVNGSITEPKLDEDSISPRTLQSDAVETDAIDNGAVTLVKLNADVTDNYYDKPTADSTFMSSFTSIPSASTAPGVEGTMAKDSDYLYVCISADAWKRSPISTW